MNITQNTKGDQFIKEMGALGIDYFSLGIIKKDKVFVAFSCPQWQKFYLESECFEFDPLVKTALLNIDIPIDWQSVTINRKKHSLIMQKRQELTGCKEGFSLAKTILAKKIGNDKKGDKSAVAILAFGTRGSFSELADTYLKHQEQMLRLVETIHQDL